MKTWTIINDNDGNDSFDVEAKDANDAAHKALEELGWWVAEGVEQEDEDWHSPGCRDSPNGRHHFTVDREYDETGETRTCEHCVEIEPTEDQ